MPYIEEIMSIGRAANGYVLTVRVPYKETDEDYYGPTVSGSGEREKVILCKDSDELATKINKLLPALADKASAEESFDRAFQEAEE
jgi:hypothetical protein